MAYKNHSNVFWGTLLYNHHLVTLELVFLIWDFKITSSYKCATQFSNQSGFKGFVLLQEIHEWRWVMGMKYTKFVLYQAREERRKNVANVWSNASAPVASQVLTGNILGGACKPRYQNFCLKKNKSKLKEKPVVAFLLSEVDGSPFTLLHASLLKFSSFRLSQISSRIHKEQFKHCHYWYMQSCGECPILY